MDAASALDLLEYDPKSLLWRGEWANKEDRRPSAAQLAREQYKELISRKAQESAADLTDLLDLDAPSPSAASSPAVQGQHSADADARAEPSGVLWPGDVVFARYGPGGSFFRARVVRVYSSRGRSMADIEWMRPEAGSPGSREYLWTCGLDETLHRNALEVSADVRRHGASTAAQATASVPQPLQLPSSRPVVSAPVRAAPAATDLVDLLDLQAPSQSSDLLSGGLPAVQVLAAVAAISGPAMAADPFAPMSGAGSSYLGMASSADVGAGYMAAGSVPAPAQANWTASAPLWGLTSPAPAAPPAPVVSAHGAQAERFDFVSDMISQATANGKSA